MKFAIGDTIRSGKYDRTLRITHISAYYYYGISHVDGVLVNAQTTVISKEVALRHNWTKVSSFEIET
jgi:hypothetical protein